MIAGDRIAVQIRRLAGTPALVLALVLAGLGAAALRPAPASAFIESGAISALPAPFECVGETEAQKAICGTQVPVGLANAFQSQISPDARNVYSIATEGALIEYSRNQASGALTVIGCLSAGAAGPKCAPEHETTGVKALFEPKALAISANGEDVYVAGQGGVLALGRNPESGLLTVLKGAKGETACVEGGAVGECEIKGAGGLGAPFGIVVSPDEGSVYVANVAGEDIAELERNTEAGALLGELRPIKGHECIGTETTSGCPDTAIGVVEPIGVAVSPDGKDLYVAAGAGKPEGDIAAFERNTSTGVLTQLEKEKACVSETLAGCKKIKALQGSEDLAISSDGKFVYAPSFSDNAVVALKREAGGQLEQLAGEAGCIASEPISGCTLLASGEARIAGSRGVALSPGTGADLYVSSANEQAVSAFTRNEVTGALTPFEKGYECVTTSFEGCGSPEFPSSGLVGLEGARRLVVSPDGTNVYVVGQGGNDLVELARTVTPTVTEVSPKEGTEAGGQLVTIEGEGFREGAQVFFAGVPAINVTVHSAGLITAESPAEAIGTVSVSVSDPAGKSAKTAKGEFVVNASTVPTVTGIYTPFGAERGATTVEIHGSEFLPGATVRFGSTPASSVVVESGVLIKASSPPGSGVQDVTVSTAKGTSATGSADRFKYNPTPPRLLGGLNADGYCVHLGYTGKTGASKLLRGAVEGPNFAFENWACETSGGTLVPIATAGAAPSEEDMCHHEYPGVPSFAFAEEPNSAFSWDCYESQPVPAPGPGPAKTATTPPAVPAPVLAVSGNVAPVSGRVLVRLPGSKRFVSLTTLTSIPFGTVINATGGRVSVTTAAPHGGTQIGEFFQGEFILTQGRNGLVVATLTGGNFSVCPTAGERAHRASAKASARRASGKHVVRRLWANAHGSFSTRGNYAAGAVAGTEWLTEDLCEGTLIRVTRDKVKVTNLLHHRTKLVLVGHSLLVKGP